MKDFLVSIKENKLITISALFVLIFCKLNFTNTEFGVYESYNRSIAYDFDLNISNQFYFENDKKLLTPNGYFYTHHSYGASILQTPFFIFTKTLGNIFQLKNNFDSSNIRPSNADPIIKPFLYQSSLEDFENKGSSVANIIIYFVAFFLMMKEFSSRYKDIGHKINQNIITIFSAAGPALFYLLYAQSTPNLTILFPLFLIFYYSRKLNQDISHLLLGLSFGLGFIIRQDFALYGFFIIFWWYQFRPSLKQLFLQASGLLIFVIPSFIYEYNKLGSLQLGYFDTVYTNFSTFIDLYFSSYGGLLIVHPVLFLLIAGIGYSLPKSFKYSSFRSEFCIAITILFVKSLLLGLTYSHNGGVLGGRQLIQDIFLVSIFVSFFIPKGIITKLVLSLFALYNFLISLVYHLQFDLKIQFFDYADCYSSYFHRILSNIPTALTYTPLVNFREVLLILANFSIPILIISYLLHRRKLKLHYIVAFTAILNLAVITSDLLNGKKSVVKDNELRTSSMCILMYYENMGSIIERINYLKANSSSSNDELDKYQQLARKYHGQCLKDLNINSYNFFDLFKYIGVEEYEDYYLNFLQ